MNGDAFFTFNFSFLLLFSAAKDRPAFRISRKSFFFCAFIRGWLIVGGACIKQLQFFFFCAKLYHPLLPIEPLVNTVEVLRNSRSIFNPRASHFFQGD